MPPSVSGLWTDATEPGEGGLLGSANAVDNLGPTPFHPFPASSPARHPGIPSKATAGTTEAQRPMSPVQLCPVEKSGPDFHRLAVPTCPKSHIRSIPKYGSGVIWLIHTVLGRLVGPNGATCTGLELLPLLHLLPGRDCSKGIPSSQGCTRPDEVIVPLWQSTRARFDTLTPFVSSIAHREIPPSSEPFNPRSGTVAASTDSFAA